MAHQIVKSSRGGLEVRGANSGHSENGKWNKVLTVKRPRDMVPTNLRTDTFLDAMTSVLKLKMSDQIQMDEVESGLSESQRRGSSRIKWLRS